MFANYATIDDVMAGEGRQVVLEQLNATPLYVQAVKALSYTKIGIAVLDNTGRETSRYASLNGKDGKIVEIIDGFGDQGDEKPNIAVKVKGSVLMDILHSVEWVKANPLSAFARYAIQFKPYNRTYFFPLVINLPKLVLKLFTQPHSHTKE